MSGENQISTAADVARLAGVSKWTVLRAFKPGARIARETRDKVMTIAKEIDYEPNLLARSFATNRTNQVAVLVDDFNNPYKMPTLRSLTAGLQREGIVTILINVDTEFSHLAALADARQRRIDSIVFFGTEHDPALIGEQMRRTSDQPIFVLARASVGDVFPSVYTDPAKAVDQLGQHLWERGYRKPLFLGGPTPIATALGRRRQYRKFWETRGVTELPELHVGAYDYHSACNRIRAFFSTVPKGSYDVLLCEYDILALAALDVLRYEFGLRVPADIAVAGFDDIDLASARSYGLTTYRQPSDEMVRQLVEMITGRKRHRTIKLTGELQVRSST